MKVRGVYKVPIHKTSISKVRKRILAELNLLTKYMTPTQMERVCNFARVQLLSEKAD